MVLAQDPNADAAQAFANLLATFDIPSVASTSMFSSHCPPTSTTHALTSTAYSDIPISLLTSSACAPAPSHHAINTPASTSNACPVTPPTNPSKWNSQPTRSGRVPQRPDPHNKVLNPLDFLEFPTDSESDDPDFQPPPEDLAHQELIQTTQIVQASSTRPNQTDNHASNPPESAIDWAQRLLDVSGLSTADLLSHFGRPAVSEQHDQLLTRPHLPNAHEADIEFDFSTLTASPAWTPAHPIDEPAREPKSTEHYARQNRVVISNPPPANGPRRDSDKPSPLTAASLAGIPFVKVSLPESDDSPEFLPPPPKRPRREPGRVAESRFSPERDPPCSPTRTSRNHVTTTLADRSASGLLPPRPLPSTFRAAAREPFRHVELLPSSTVSTPLDRDYHHAESPCESLADSEYVVDSQRPLVLNKNGLPRAKPGPKPKAKVEPLLVDKEDFMRRKREGMRASRERKREYVEELEDRCRELMNEYVYLPPRTKTLFPSCQFHSVFLTPGLPFFFHRNTRLREENEQLMRESRENWKARALGLTHSQPPTSSSSTSTFKGNSPSRRIKGLRAIAPNLQGRTVLDMMAKRSRTTATYGGPSRRPS